jgi:hypothetical protein
MTPPNAKRLALKYRRRINADTFSGGATYHTQDIPAENKVDMDKENTAAAYGHAAQTNQEILDLMENAANLLIDQMAGIASKNTIPAAGKFLTYGMLESIIPETIFRKVETVAFEPEIVVSFDLDDYAYPVALNLFIVGEDLPKKAEPVTAEMYQNWKTGNWYENNTIPIFRVTPAPLSGKVGVTVYYQGADTVSVPSGAHIEFFYIAKQKKIENTTDLILSSRYDEHILNIMVQSYTGYK